jgi:alpha-mannosidase
MKVGLRILNYGVMAVVVIAAITVGNIPAYAQISSATAANIAHKLSGDSQNVVSRLAALNSFPADEWRLHVGDVPHGESTDIDDSAWETVKPRSKTSSGTVWYRRLIEVPERLQGYDLTGSRIWFQFSAGASSPVTQIIYFNGRRVAMGEELEPTVLFDKAQPHDKVLVAVKLVSLADATNFDAVRLKIDFPENRPSPQNILSELLSAAEVIPYVSGNVAGETVTLDAAVRSVDVESLDANDQAKFDASLIRCEAALEKLRPTLQAASFHLTGNSHIDAAWLWPWSETVDVVRRTFGTALQLMNEYPDYTFTQSSAVFNSWLAEKYPAINKEIKKRVKEGRWEIVGGMWVEPDLNLPDGESEARSLLIGKRWYEENYGVDVQIGWNPDSFGYNWQLPQIYKKSGVNYFVTQKLTWNDANPLPFNLFWWESPDGSRVLTYFPRGYAHKDLDPARLSGDFAATGNDAPGLTEMMDLYGVGDHGGGPTRAILDQGVHWMEPDRIAPKMQFGTAAAYFSTVETKLASQSRIWDYRSIAQGYENPSAPPAGQISIPTWNDELYLEYHRGVYTTQAKMKRNLREAPEWTLNAEKFASLAWLDGNAYPGDNLTEAWKKIAFNDFHDLAAGSGTEAVYKDAQRDFDQVYWSTNEISSNALGTIAAHADTKVAGEVPVFVFNPLAWARSGLVKVDVQMKEPTHDVSVLDPENNVLPSEVLSSDPATNIFHLLVQAKDIPSMGYKVLHVIPARRPFKSDLRVAGTTMENAALHVEVDPKTGCVTSLYNVAAHFETLAAGSCGNELQAFNDTPQKYDAWNIDPGTLDAPPADLLMVDSVKVIEKGPMRAVVRVTRTWQHSKIVQDIELYAGTDEVVVVNDIDWHETHVLLKSAFTLAAGSPFATYEIPFGSIERPTTRTDSWDKARFEVPAQRWADLGDGQHGFSLINDSKFGYDGVGNTLRLTLLRSPEYPDPNADRGNQHFSYALYPHAGDWKQALTVRHGYDFNYELAAMQVEAHAGSMQAENSFVSISQDNVVLTAMKKAEDTNSLIFHLYEWAGKTNTIELHVPPGAAGATETNLLEKPEGGPLAINSDIVAVPVHPFEIVAIRVDYPRRAMEKISTDTSSFELKK